MDTNFLIRALRTDTTFNRQLRGWVSAGEDVGISAIAWAEFLCGPLASEDAASASELLPNPEPLLAVDAARAAELFNAGGRRKGSLTDCLIAASCLRLGARLATENADDFRRFEPMGLQIVTAE
ncbi:MAG: PIN domain-containing protein [Tepidisphaeraceae bacterium]